MRPQGSRTFADRLEQFGNSPALLTAGEVIDYRSLAARADAFAERLPAGPQLALLDTANDVGAIVAYLALLRAGHPVILSHEGAAGHQQLIDTFDPTLFVAADGAVTLREAAAPPTLHRELAVLLSTSGTTGATKLVRLSTENITENACSIAEYLEIVDTDRAITSLPFHYSYGLSVVNSHLSVGASLLLTDRSVSDPEFFDLFDRLGATSLAGVPYTYEMLELAGFRDRASPSLRTLTQAGGRLPVELARAYGAWTRERGARFYVMYGQTEATARIAYVPPGQLQGNEGTIGVAIPRGELTIETDATAGPASEGELVYRGPNVMMGYAESAADLVRGKEVEVLHTGDLAVREPNGFFRITGRSKRFSKLFGLRVSHDQVEQIARDFGAVAAVTGNDEFLAVSTTGTGADALRRHLAGTLGVPERVVLVDPRDNLPLLPSGKVDYRAILAAAETRWAAEPVSMSPLIDLYRDAFPGRSVDQRDSFVRLGGDSLVYVTIAAEIEDRLGRLPKGWEERSIGELEDMSPQATKSSGIDSEILLRALAIVAIVINHASDRVVGGGTGALLLLCGYNWARFQRTRMVRGEFWRSVGDFSLRVVAPVYFITVAVALLHEWPGWPSLFLVSNFSGQHRGILEPFWFIEALFQSTLIMAVICSIPAVRRAIAERPFAFGWALLAASLAVGWIAAGLFSHAGLANRTPDVLFPMIALGWCAYFAEGKGRFAVMVAAIGIALWDMSHWASLGLVKFGMLHREVWPVGAAFLVMFLPRLPMPAALRRIFVTISIASFTIYIVHGLPIWMINHLGGEELGLLKVASGIVLGLAMQPVMGWGIAILWRLRGQRLPKSPPLVQEAP